MQIGCSNYQIENKCKKYLVSPLQQLKLMVHTVKLGSQYFNERLVFKFNGNDFKSYSLELEIAVFIDFLYK